MFRPLFNAALPVAEFRAWYWQKEELVQFCRELGLKTIGAKQHLAKTIEWSLSGQTPATSHQRGTRMPPMTSHFSQDTVVKLGWRCSQGLRAFFKRECGAGFHFNAAMREFVRTGVGKSLTDGINLYRDSTKQKQKRDIGSQFEFNRHMREFFLDNANATRSDALKAWYQTRSTRRTIVANQ